MSEEARRGDQILLVSESQVVEGCQEWTLETELRFSRRAVSSLNCWTIPQVHWKTFSRRFIWRGKTLHPPNWDVIWYKVGQGKCCCSLPACLHPCWWVHPSCVWLCYFYPLLTFQESCRPSIPDWKYWEIQVCRLSSYWILSLSRVLPIATIGLSSVHPRN